MVCTDGYKNERKGEKKYDEKDVQKQAFARSVFPVHGNGMYYKQRTGKRKKIDREGRGQYYMENRKGCTYPFGKGEDEKLWS